jgi:hypothetical protein
VSLWGETVENPAPTSEMKRFNDALRQVLRVSKDELKERLAQEEASKVGKPKRGPKAKPDKTPPISTVPVKERESPMPVDVSSNEALVRSPLDPNEIAGTYSEVRREQKEVDAFINERAESIRRGARRAPKRFRI